MDTSQALTSSSNVQERAKAIELKILPKILAGFVPIEIKIEERKYDAVLLDDDQLICMTWENGARKNGKKLLSASKDF